ncbi:MAG: hypothetical protein KJO61_16030, partial [Deltaproteobacteria bacterium]|nr:hypothetical protein [Deltaproteobacteria bacterium]
TTHYFNSCDTKLNQIDLVAKMSGILNINDCRRSVTDRRRNSGANHFPERRSCRFRRSASDRRTPRNVRVIRKGTERRRALKGI